MTYRELEDKAKQYLATFPDQTPEQIYINGYLAGYGQRGRDDGQDEKPKAEKYDLADVVARFNATCAAYSSVKVLSANRRKKLRLRLEEMASFGQPMDIVQAVFDKMQASDFLRGGNAKGWKASFDWLIINDNNWLKVYEGQYDNRSGAASAKKVNDYWG